MSGVPPGFSADEIAPTIPASVAVAYEREARRHGKYATLVIDPPWDYRVRYLPARGTSNFNTGAKARTKRAAAANYPCMSMDELRALPVDEWAAENAHLYLWVTNAYLVEAHELARSWGFEPKTLLTWVKPGIGMGFYFRNNTEHVLFAVKGKLKAHRRDLQTAFNWPRGRHSEKPAAFYDMVESMSPGPRLDVFARAQRFHWDTWGNEAYTAPELAAVKL